MHRIKIPVFLTFTLALFFSSSYAQQFDSQVNLILERLPLEKQEKLKDLADAMEIYFSDTDWTGENFENLISLTVQVFLEDKSTTFEDRYAGTFLISNNNDLQYSDKYWRFPYQENEFLNMGSGSPFTNFLDFYVYIILGHEYDKLGKLAGSEYFEKAKTIAEQGLFSSQFSLGWKERVALIDRLMSEDYKPFRLMKDTYYLGLSYLGDEEKTALKYCEKALLSLVDILKENPEHQEAEQFLDANYIDIIDMFQNNPDLLRKLSYVDPDHKDTYQKYIEQY